MYALFDIGETSEHGFHEEELEVGEILSIGFDERYDAITIVFAEQPDETYFLAPGRVTKEEANRACMTAFNEGKVNLTTYGNYYDHGDAISIVRDLRFEEEEEEEQEWE